MTKVSFFTRDSSIYGFSIKGHAGARTLGEYDMVCAAISGIVYTALGALDELCGINTYREADGHIEMMLPVIFEQNVKEKASVILKTMEIGLKQIEKQYPRFIRTACREV